ncbi:MAG: tetratricopeptide repeat protein, partial [Gammaproteobacteria bacterium]|nr:tetratricopeptide repeat protein [Gammaproteobacteria bacterium]
MMSIIHTMRKVLVVVIVVGLASCGGADERKDKYLEKGKAYLESNNLDKARIEFKNVLQIDPKDAEVYFYMGLLEEKNNEPNKAYGFYNKAHELMPDYVEPKLKLAEIYTVIGGEEYSGKAKKLLNEILLGDSQNTKARLIQQQISYKEGNEEAAIKEIEKLVEEDPLLDNGINLLTSAYVAKGENDKAINLLDKGIAVNFGNVAFRSKKVSILIKEKRFEDAEKELIEIVNLDKSIYASRLALSSFYAKTSQLDKAEKVLREGLSEAPEDVNRALILVQFLISRKGRDHAIDELNNMIAANPDVYELQLTLARIFKDSNENDKAKKIFSSIIRESNSAIDRTHANNLMA